MTGEELKEAVREKLNGYINSQKRCHITTISSSKFPNGKFHNGLVVKFSLDNSKIMFLDDVEDVILIPLILIKSPSDIEDFKER